MTGTSRRGPVVPRRIVVIVVALLLAVFQVGVVQSRPSFANAGAGSSISSPWLFAGPSTITQGYGCTNVSAEPTPLDSRCSGNPNGTHWHMGIDIAGGSANVTCGTPVYVGRHITVRYKAAGVLDGLLDDGNNLVILHMQVMNVVVGQAYPSGSLLGQVGNVAPSGGYSSGCHIHFQIDGPSHTPGQIEDWTDINPSVELAWTPGQQVTVADYPTGTRMDVFLRGTNGAAYHAVMSDANHIAPWEFLGGGFLGAPNASWRADGSELDAFAIGLNHVVFENIFKSARWGGWHSLNGTSGLSAREEVTVARAPDGVGIDLFVRGTDGYGYQASMDDGSTLGPWQNMGSTQLLGAPGASWTGDGRELTAFAIGKDDHTVYRDRALPCTTPPCPFLPSGFTWRGWQKMTGLSGVAGTEQVGVARNPGGVRLDIFVRGTNGAPYHALNGSVLDPWQGVGSSALQQVLGAPTATWNTGSLLVVVAVSPINWTVYRTICSFASGACTWSGWAILNGTSG